MVNHSTVNQAEQWRIWAMQAQAGDKHAYHALLKAIYPYIVNNVNAGIRNYEAAEDIGQEVLISIHKSLNTYTPDRPFKPWLMAIINFRKTDYLRKYYAQRQDQTSTIETNPEYSNEAVLETPRIGEMKDIEAALKTIPPKQRAIFKRVKIEGFSTEEVAAEMDMKASAVKVSAHRAMKKLQELLK